MQIGTRWAVGSATPDGLPGVFVAAITDAESERNLTQGSWTLTWLEGRPVATHPAELRLALRADGTVATQSGSEPDLGIGDEDDDDDWLS